MSAAYPPGSVSDAVLDTGTKMKATLMGALKIGSANFSSLGAKLKTGISGAPAPIRSLSSPTSVPDPSDALAPLPWPMPSEDQLHTPRRMGEHIAAQIASLTKESAPPQSPDRADSFLSKALQRVATVAAEFAESVANEDERHDSGKDKSESAETTSADDRKSESSDDDCQLDKWDAEDPDQQKAEPEKSENEIVLLSTDDTHPLSKDAPAEERPVATVAVATEEPPKPSKSPKKEIAAAVPPKDKSPLLERQTETSVPISVAVTQEHTVSVDVSVRISSPGTSPPAVAASPAPKTSELPPLIPQIAAFDASIPSSVKKQGRQIVDHVIPTGGHLKLQFTVVLFGNKNVGKTSIIRRLITGPEGEILPTRATVVMDITTKTFILENEDVVELSLWDTAGAEEYKTFLPMYMRRLDAAVLVYAVNDPESMRAIGPWHEYVAKEAPWCAQWYAVANKVDTVVADDGTPTIHSYNLDRGAELARCYEIPEFVCTSALKGNNVQVLFMNIARGLRNRHVEMRKLAPRSMSSTDSASAAEYMKRFGSSADPHPVREATGVKSEVIVLRNSSSPAEAVPAAAPKRKGVGAWLSKYKWGNGISSKKKKYATEDEYLNSPEFKQEYKKSVERMKRREAVLGDGMYSWCCIS